jgi:hypothetical protein
MQKNQRLVIMFNTFLIRTCSQRCGGIAEMPSTKRKRESSVNEVSGMKTAQTTCAQPWPSVGLQARKNESGGGRMRSFRLRSRFRRGQSRQSVL